MAEQNTATIDASTYHQLLRSARSRLAAFPQETLSPECLVSEAWLKLCTAQRGNSSSGSQRFHATASLAMKQILVDRHRAVFAVKRGGGANHVPLEEGTTGARSTISFRVDMDHALDRLSRQRPMLLQVFLLRALEGLTVRETAQACARSLRSTERDWAKARELLMAFLDSEGRAGTNRMEALGTAGQSL